MIVLSTISESVGFDSRSMSTAVLDLAITTTKWIVQKRGFHFESLGLSIRDVAMDAVAELLTDDGNEMPIIRYLKESAEGSGTLRRKERKRTLGSIYESTNISRILAETSTHRVSKIIDLRHQDRRGSTNLP